MTVLAAVGMIAMGAGCLDPEGAHLDDPGGEADDLGGPGLDGADGGAPAPLGRWLPLGTVTETIDRERGVRLTTSVVDVEVRPTVAADLAPPEGDFEIAYTGSTKAATEVVNTLAESAGAFSGGASSIRAQVFGHGLPPNAYPWQLRDSETVTVTYNKVAESWPLGAELADIEYSLRFVTRGSIDGEGWYLANITFVPVSADLDATVSATISGQTSAAENWNTADPTNPVALVRVYLTFYLDGWIGSMHAFDDLQLYGHEDRVFGSFGSFD